MNGVFVRGLAAADIPALVEILVRRGNFRTEEVLVAREVLDAAAAASAQDYHAFVVEGDGMPVGFVCFGAVPLTSQSWDLYWIGVAEEQGRAGLGRALLERAEDEVRRRGGRRLYIDTSATAAYLPARRFYEKNGYQSAARLDDFYQPGDAKIIYVKVLG